MAKIDIRQLDEFAHTFVVDVKEGDVPVWDDTEKEFVPESPIVFRRIMLLMGA